MTAVKLNNVSKYFKLYHNPVTGPVREFLFFWKAEQFYQRFTAINDVSMEIAKGEVVGIIGPNGAGKSTLLKMMAGLLPVDRGTIEVNGKITALLALGVGVHPEFTGEENILYSGMLLGMSKREVLQKLPGIIEFAELGEFIHHPFRTYSSGMRARLLFSISMSIEPDILIVDEALATGDSYFVQKATRCIHDLCKSGATIIFVSHSLQQVQQLCQRAFLLAEGRVIDEGDPTKVIASYDKWAFAKQQAIHKRIIASKYQSVRGSGEIVLTDIKLKNRGGEETTGFYSGDRLVIELRYENDLTPDKKIALFVGILRYEDQSYICEVDTDGDRSKELFGKTTFALEDRGIVRITLDPLIVQYGHYSLWIILFNPDDDKYYCEYRNVSSFFVAGRHQAISLGSAFFWHPGTTAIE